MGTGMVLVVGWLWWCHYSLLLLLLLLLVVVVVVVVVALLLATIETAPRINLVSAAEGVGNTSCDRDGSPMQVK